jgi:hypothetical protein
MKLNPLWILLVFVPAMNAATITCTAGAASVPVFDPTSISGAVGDYTLDCTGGITVVPPNPIPEINVTTFMNVPVLNTGSWVLSDGVNMTPGILGTSNEVEFIGVPFNPPGAGHLVFTVENIFVNPSAEGPGFQFMEEASINTNISFSITNPQQVVAENAVPEPFTLGFLGVGMSVMWLGRKRG